MNPLDNQPYEGPSFSRYSLNSAKLDHHHLHLSKSAQLCRPLAALPLTRLEVHSSYRPRLPLLLLDPKSPEKPTSKAHIPECLNPTSLDSLTPKASGAISRTNTLFQACQSSPKKGFADQLELPPNPMIALQDGDLLRNSRENVEKYLKKSAYESSKNTVMVHTQTTEQGPVYPLERQESLSYIHRTPTPTPINPRFSDDEGDDGQLEIENDDPDPARIPAYVKTVRHIPTKEKSSLPEKPSKSCSSDCIVL